MGKPINFEEYLQESSRIDERYAIGELKWEDAEKEQHLLRLKFMFPKIAEILENDLLEQKRINEEFGYMGVNYE